MGEASLNRDELHGKLQVERWEKKNRSAELRFVPTNPRLPFWETSTHHRPLYSTCEALDTIYHPGCPKKVQVRGLGGQHEHRPNAPQTPHALRPQRPLQTQTDASPMTRKRTSITCSLIAKANLRPWIYQCVCVACELSLTDLLCNVVLLGHSQL